MGFFLSKTWPFWLLAALLAALIAWLLCRWWSSRTGAASGVSVDGSHELSSAQALLRTREAELERVATERNAHLAELTDLRPKAAAHDGLAAQLEGLRTSSVPMAEHQARVDALNAQVTSLTGKVSELGTQVGQVPDLQARIGQLQGQAGQVDALHARIAELQGPAGQAPALQARITDLEAQAGQVDGLRARIAELEGTATQVPALNARIAELEGQAGQVSGLQARIAELEGQAAQRDAAKPDVSTAAPLLGFPVAVDDLTVVEGIGPKIAGLCHDAGIQTWRQLSQTPVSRLQEILDAAGPRYQIHDPGTWPKQAALLADGHWEPFKSWTDQLKGGRSAAE